MRPDRQENDVRRSEGHPAFPSRVSVVIPCFNAGRLLELAVASVLAQSHEDWEIVIVNDGSDDPGTLETLERLRSAKHRIVDQPNEGLASARNRGVREATGAYVQFLDADDLIEPTKLASQVGILGGDPDIDAVVCDYVFTDAGGKERRNHEGVRTRILEPPAEDVLFRWERGLSIPIHCALFRAGAWAGEEPFVPGLRAKEDWVFWATLALAGRRIVYQAEPLALYRIHEGGMSRSLAGAMASMAEAALILVDRVPETMKGRFRRETIRHLRTAYAAPLDDPAAFRPLRHRAVDRLHAFVGKLPLGSHLTRRIKRIVVGRH
jgi:O-antigen biosynthesis protein